MKSTTRVYSINTGTGPAWSAKYGVAGIPATYAFVDGKYIGKIEGEATVGNIFEGINQHLKH